MSKGLKKLMEDLGVKTYDELYDYINDPAHEDEEIVKQIKEMISIFGK